ncbi:DUF947-domain-containing protein [Lophium mytilinum]|uniref:rRNA biogenesis protein RRP36 n=1 Tax=Lophium mytilinum TaxID=390894 RepID=A0A6A6QX51_9PEZI|nr:DUF947-domain-containing protein [Lophium mytilinum]
MVLQKTLNRSLRAQDDESDDEQYSGASGGSSPSVLDTGDADDINIASSESEDEDPQAKLSTVSFGTVAKAQDEILKQGGGSRKRKRGSDAEGQSSQLQALRERLRELKAQKSNSKADPIQQSRASREKEEDSEDSDSDSSSSNQPTHARSSKHAPATQSSKRTVTRNRQVVEVKKPVPRDPRFDPLTGPSPDDSKFKKRYGFLDQYKASEMAEMRATIKKTKNAAEKEQLKRDLLAMENQQKAQESKEQRQKIISEHRKKEKELVKDGKKPFFLKKSETKKLALVDRFAKMKSKDREHLIERRRKKASQKERKNMPVDRRGV